MRIVAVAACVVMSGCFWDADQVDACELRCNVAGTNRHCINTTSGGTVCVDKDRPCGAGKREGCVDGKHSTRCHIEASGDGYLGVVGPEVCPGENEVCHDTSTGFVCTPTPKSFCVPQFFPQCRVDDGVYVECHGTSAARYVVVPNPCPCVGAHCSTCRGDAGTAFCE